MLLALCVFSHNHMQLLFSSAFYYTRHPAKIKNKGCVNLHKYTVQNKNLIAKVAFCIEEWEYWNGSSSTQWKTVLLNVPWRDYWDHLNFFLRWGHLTPTPSSQFKYSCSFSQHLNARLKKDPISNWGICFLFSFSHLESADWLANLKQQNEPILSHQTNNRNLKEWSNYLILFWI